MPIHNKRKRQNWEKEFYKNGYPTEVIVISSESPQPPASSGTTTSTSSSSATNHDILKTLVLEPDPKRQKWNYNNDQSILAYHLFPSNNKSFTINSKNRTFISNTNEPRLTTKESPFDDKDGHYIVRPNDLLTDQYKIMRLLGQGTFGKVVECFDRVRRTFCAIKIIRAIPKYRDASKTEIKVLNTLKKHDPLNLNQCIHLIEWFDYRNHICMVFELLGVSLFDHLKSNHFKPLTPHNIQHLAKQLLNSVAFLHNDLKLIHTDLKPENILLVNPANLEIRLIDFGSATFEHDYHSNIVSTRHYRAPEIILERGWSYPCDLWSVGCILVELFIGEALFQTHDNEEHLVMMDIILGPLPKHMQTVRRSTRQYKNIKPLEKLIPPTSKETSYLLDLLRKFFVYEPSQRISAREALKHPFFYI
ncbi:kinase-like domain-containing protein [Cokeromyces recurvatus]|uniref:kinase-like domain-containing protein n=1 Tax=Cokeromyces recurvatus TaxID=90255 RepID=UPI002220C3E8|nr:kinase-like domain-containing protein [Cokeromyces recurvatus]KAI7900929.1 kinase-like domain-containing protein [Cokeromyces recurvatus]